MTIFYPDISSAQGDISLAGALAVFIKVTEGTGYVNPFYLSRYADAQHHGAFACAYHFLLGGNGAGQAAHARAHTNPLTPLMLDFEPEPPVGSFPKIADAVAFIDAYRKLGGICHLLYFPRWYWQQLGSPDLAPFRDRGMALVSSAYAPYTDSDSGTGWQTYGGMTPKVWQYTDRLHFNGASVDFNAYRGSYAGKQDAASVHACLAEFRALASGTAPAPKPSPAPAPAPDPAPQPLPSPEASVIELDTTVASHPLLIDFGTKTMDLLSVNTEADPCVVEVTFLHQGADVKSYSLSWGTADTVGSGIEVPEGIKKARLDVVSGGGLPVAVRYNA